MSENSRTYRLISVCVTFLTLIIGMLKIITKYVFPKNENEYITRIVELIQKNDLENKKENIKARNKEGSDMLAIDEIKG